MSWSALAICCLYGTTVKCYLTIAYQSTLTYRQRVDTLWAVRKKQKHLAPEGFILLLREGMEKRKISLNQLAEQAGISPAFLSRIMNKERSLPADKAILRLAQVLDLQPNERLLTEAGRIPEEYMSVLNQTGVPELLRAAGTLNDDDKRELLKMAKSLALKRRRGGK